MYFQPPTSLNRHEREGFTLLLVITMLALFAVVGVGFVIYAQSSATAARLAAQSKEVQQPEVDPELMMSYFFGQLLYGADNGPAGTQSGMRGNDLGTNLYNYDPTQPNIDPFSGSGRLHFAPLQPAILGGDDFPLINYTYFRQDGLVRDPGHTGLRNTPNDAVGPVEIGLNPGHTYPDLHNLFLAVMNGDGEIVAQCFYRRGHAFGELGPNNPNWYDNTKRYLSYQILRPRPADMGPGFPATADGGGDVKCVANAKGVPEMRFDNATNTWVKTGNYYNNDSIWIDLGHPVMVGPDNRKFKPLFAAVIIDLDSKVNLNVHGNLHYQHDDHFSHQGWGPWAVNLKPVLSLDPNEWKNIFRGNGSLSGRYGADQQPKTSGGQTSTGRPPRHFAQVDFDGYGPGGANSAFVLPGEGSYPPYVAMPGFPSTRYENNNVNERTNHPAQFNFFNPQGDDRIFHIRNMESILRHLDTNSPAHTSELFELLPKNLLTSPRVRRLVTTHSMDLSRPNFLPWLHDPTASPYELKLALNGQRFAEGTPLKSPPVGPGQNLPQSGEFSTTYDGAGTPFGSYRGAPAGMGRLNLNRNLPQYPQPTSSDPAAADHLQKARINYSDAAVRTTYGAAELARQQLAKDIFDRLLWVTTGLSPSDTAAMGSVKKGTPRYQAFRWLAQLAVNIVDYRDEDDYVTVLQWHPTVRNEYVFGTELPRVVINEVYAGANERQGNKGKGIGLGKRGTDDINFWIELLNPFQADGQLWENGGARLQVKNDPGFRSYGQEYPIYRIEIVDTKENKLAQPGLVDPQNVKGDVRGRKELEVNDWTPAAPPKVADPWLIKPVGSQWSGPNAGNQGFFVAGPDKQFSDGSIEATLKVKQNGKKEGLSYDYKDATGKDNVNPTDMPSYIVVLKRLATPHLPPQEEAPDTGANWKKRLGYYNPYVTVDYVSGVAGQLGDGGRFFLPNQNVVKRESYGCIQPYVSELKPQELPPPAPKGNFVHHTFFRHNSKSRNAPANPVNNDTLSMPFDWLVHLDRQLISPMELLHVSAYHPHELTQQFRPDPATNNYLHYAKWFKEDTRIYRLFSLLETASRADGVIAGRRVPGKMNINTIWDIETFKALCDAQNIRLTQTEVETIFQNLMKSRTPNAYSAVSGGVAMAGDRPFLTHATGVRPNNASEKQSPGSGIKDTFLRDIAGGNDPAKARLFGVPVKYAQGADPKTDPPIKASTHPYRRAELMTKIFSNTTTRSNVFAVWLTVGYFEVVDESTRPIKLGAEIGRADNRHVRHRMFAIVDRTQLGVLPSQLTNLKSAVTLTAADRAAGKKPGLQTVQLQRTFGQAQKPNWNLPMPVAGFNFKIRPGQRLRIGNENIVVKSVDHGAQTITAYFEAEHVVGETVRLIGTPGPNGIVSVYGHPGPQPNFNAREYPAVVPYFSMIERTGG